MAPSRWSFCYGQAISRSTYADLFAVFGTTYGVGDGSTTFNLPDCRGRALAGQDDMGGTSANRLTTPINGDALGAAGGTESHTLTAAQIPVLSGTSSSGGSHTHTVNNGTQLVRFVGNGNGDTGQSGPALFYEEFSLSTSSAGTHSHTVSITSGGGNEHSNLQPMIIFNVIVFHGVA